MTEESTRPERRIWRSDVRKDVEDELAFHLEMRRRDFAGRGADDEAARAAASRRFGNLQEIAETCRRIDEQWLREQRRASMWTDIRHDALYAMRSLAKTPGFTAVAVLTLALGIGANTAIFSVINSVLLRPLPYRDADRIVFVWTRTQNAARAPLSPARYLDFRDRMQSLTGLAGICQFSVRLTGGGDPEQIDASSVSSSFFDVLGARPLLGDPFHAATADARAVVLSYGLWVRRFGSDRGIVGREITINGTARRVAAVMAKDFSWPAVTALPNNGGGPELWIPGAGHDIPRTPTDSPTEDLSTNRGLGILRAVARLGDGVTVEQAQREADLISARLAAEYPRTDQGRGAAVVPLRSQFFGAVTRPLGVLLGAVAFVLAIAAANVASLLLGRGVSRRKEIAVRLALGASRARVVRQLLTESVVLALAGSVAGLLLAWWAERWLVALSPGGVLRLSETSIDPVVLGFSFLVAMVTGLVFGAVPAWQVSRTSPHEDLKNGGARGSEGSRGGRTRDALVAFEVGIALVLLVGAGLLLRSFSALSSVDTGIDTRNLLTFAISAPGRGGPPAQQSAFYDAVLSRIASLPGVTHVGAAVTLPIGGDDFSTQYIVEGQPVPAPGEEPSAGWQIVSRGYFEAIGMRIKAGRDFRPGDTPDAPGVALVNETLARQAWPGVDPVGRRMRLGRDAANPWLTVVGIVNDIRHRGPAVEPRPELYQPLTQQSFGGMAFVVRTTGNPMTVVPQVRAAVAGLSPGLPISAVATMDEHIERALSRPRFMSTLTAAFGALALALALVGIYGVMSYSVTQRAREIAIRMAVGARASDVVLMVVTKALALAGAGIVVGLAAAAWTTRVLSGLLFGVTATDAATYAIASAALLAVALLAGAVPALRATRIDGVTVLRS